MNRLNDEVHRPERAEADFRADVGDKIEQEKRIHGAEQHGNHSRKNGNENRDAQNQVEQNGKERQNVKSSCNKRSDYAQKHKTQRRCRKETMDKRPRAIFPVSH